MKYPAVYLTTGIQDPRVDPWQPAKWRRACRGRRRRASRSLLRVDFQAGHFDIGATREQADAEFVDMMAFVLWQTGVPAFQPKV